MLCEQRVVCDYNQVRVWSHRPWTLSPTVTKNQVPLTRLLLSRLDVCDEWCLPQQTSPSLVLWVFLNPVHGGMFKLFLIDHNWFTHQLTDSEMDGSQRHPTGVVFSNNKSMIIMLRERGGETLMCLIWIFIDPVFFLEGPIEIKRPWSPGQDDHTKSFTWI